MRKLTLNVGTRDTKDFTGTATSAAGLATLVVMTENYTGKLEERHET